MRKVIVSNVVSLDGFFEGPNFEGPNKDKLGWVVVDAEFLAYAQDMLNAADALLFGAHTYEHMAAHWPTAPVDAMADKMNSLPKIVFSKTLPEAKWNNSRIVRTDIREEVLKLKDQPGKDLVVLGSAQLASFLLQLRLVDEYRVLLQPVLLGTGRTLFGDVTQKMDLKLLGTRTFGSGVILFTYERI